ncbi:MAG TPA: hypothetical protein VMK65_02325 [Longimicrobiales bacterium]|nr:hypothetical protein [Longimicrobiales bacterium]
MTVRHRRPRRLTTALFLLLHLLVAGGVGLAEARADGGTGEAAPHLTAVGGDECPPYHSHLDCQLCRTLRLSAAPAGLSGTLPLPLDAPRALIAAARQAGPAAAPLASVRSRAPPLA